MKFDDSGTAFIPMIVMVSARDMAGIYEHYKIPHKPRMDPPFYDPHPDFDYERTTLSHLDVVCIRWCKKIHHENHD